MRKGQVYLTLHCTQQHPAWATLITFTKMIFYLTISMQHFFRKHPNVVWNVIILLVYRVPGLCRRSGVSTNTHRTNMKLGPFELRAKCAPFILSPFSLLLLKIPLNPKNRENRSSATCQKMNSKIDFSRQLGRKSKIRSPKVVLQTSGYRVVPTTRLSISGKAKAQRF